MPKGVYTHRRMSLADRFWPKVEKTSGCWLWRGARLKTGYGSINRGGHDGASVKAHRASWELHFGTIPTGLHVLHRCDTPLCVRPDHLFLGSHADNMRDMAQKRRSTIGDRNPSRLYPERVARGSRNGNAVINDIAVLCVRYLGSCGLPQPLIAGAYGISQSTVSLICNRRRWAHLQGAIA